MISATPNAGAAHRVFSFTINVDPAIVPITTAIIIGQSLLINETKLGPAINCQTFVTKEGMSKSAAAAIGDMIAPRTPMATVGNPMPVTPLTIPAKKNVTVTEMINHRDKPVIY